MIFVFQLFILHMVSYWFMVALYTVPWGRLDRNQWPEKDGTKAAMVVLKNQLVYTGVFAIPFYYYPVPMASWHGIWQLPAIVLLTDVLFYVMHRIVHTKYLYMKVHRVHHLFNRSIAVGALYAHPIEHIFVNLLTAIAPMFIVRASPAIAMLWTVIASANTIVGHSATRRDEYHGIHHRYYTYNYGVGPMLMDRLFGTLKEAKKINSSM